MPPSEFESLFELAILVAKTITLLTIVFTRAWMSSGRLPFSKFVGVWYWFMILGLQKIFDILLMCG